MFNKVPVFILITFFSLPALAETFDINRLPRGSEVTLLRPATTMVPLTTRVQLSATGTPQTVSMRAVWKGAVVPGKSINVAIYDKTKDRVQHIKVVPGIPFLYTFRSLDSIVVVPQMPKGPRDARVISNLKLKLESDKPLSIAR